MRYRALQVCVVLFASAASAGAQGTEQERERAVRERAEAARERAAEVRERARTMVGGMVNDSALMNRATLGVTLSPTGNRRDTLGIFISSVAADGPAERAGVYEGDRIASINGVDVRTQTSDADDPYLAGVAQRRLTLELRKLTPGQRVNLRVWSGGRYKDVQVTTGRYQDVYRNRRTQIRIGGNMIWPELAPVHGTANIHVAPLTPGRIMMRAPRVSPTPRIAPVPRLMPLPREDRVEFEDFEGALVASVEWPDFNFDFTPFAEIGEALEDLDLFRLDELLEESIDFSEPVELELDVDASTHEAIRHASETLDGLERVVGAL
jgi:hypothetical protein